MSWQQYKGELIPAAIQGGPVSPGETTGRPRDVPNPQKPTTDPPWWGTCVAWCAAGLRRSLGWVRAKPRAAVAPDRYSDQILVSPHGTTATPSLILIHIPP